MFSPCVPNALLAFSLSHPPILPCRLLLFLTPASDLRMQVLQKPLFAKCWKRCMSHLPLLKYSHMLPYLLDSLRWELVTLISLNSLLRPLLRKVRFYLYVLIFLFFFPFFDHFPPYIFAILLHLRTPHDSLPTEISCKGMEEDGLSSPFTRYLCLALGLLYLGKGERAEVALAALAVVSGACDVLPRFLTSRSDG